MFLQLLYSNWYLIIKLNSDINYTFFYRDLYYKVQYVNPYLSLHYDYVTRLSFCIVDLYSFKKHNTSNTHNEVNISILQSLNSCLPDRCMLESYWIVCEGAHLLVNTCAFVGIIY